MKLTLNRRPHFGMRVRLEGRRDDEPWGTYSTAIVEPARPGEDVEAVVDRAERELSALADRWVACYDHGIEFRLAASGSL